MYTVSNCLICFVVCDLALQGDLNFSILFVAALDENAPESELDVETLQDMYRTNSGSELIEGNFDIPTEGVLFFLWDNKFDWSANKQLSYSITVSQVT